MIRQLPFPLVLAFILLLFAAHQYSLQAPSVIPADPPENQFSGQRAFDILKTLLADIDAHPVGSKQNALVKQRIIKHMTSLEIEVQEQNTWSCGPKRNVCAPVQNLIGIIPGKRLDSFIVLMAHYDSVPQAPGAGDDGAAVAAILESARILKQEAPFEHSIMLLITDAEEMGLLGAEAFYNQHPLAKKVAAVLDFEGSGTTGVSLVLRTSKLNELLINSLTTNNVSALGYSFTNELFRRMPNDTDFSVSLRAGLPGIDFAFAAERNHYHTPNDNLENIDLRTIQHHGENMLPLTRLLAEQDLDQLGSHLVYATAYGAWLQWSADLTWPLLILALILLFMAARMQAIKPLKLLWHLGFQLVIFITTILVAYLCFELIKKLQGTVVSWPAHSDYHLIALFGSTLLGGSLAAILLSRWLDAESFYFGAWSLWAMLSLLLSWYLPDVVDLVLPTLLAAAIASFAASLAQTKNKTWAAGSLRLLSLSLAIPATIGVVITLEESQGQGLIIATMPFIALFMCISLPLVNPRNIKLTAGFAGLATCAALVMIGINPLYSAHRPQHLNIYYVGDLDNKTASYHLRTQQTLPDRLNKLMPFTESEHSPLPLSQLKINNGAKIKPAVLAAPTFQVLRKYAEGQQTIVDLEIKSPRAADRMAIYLPADVKLSRVNIGGTSFEPVLSNEDGAAAAFQLNFVGVYNKTLRLQLSFDRPMQASKLPAYLLDFSTELPESGQALYSARSPLASPVHQGDQAVLFRQIEI